MAHLMFNWFISGPPSSLRQSHCEVSLLLYSPPPPNTHWWSTNRRCLWHLGCCIALLWFFISTLQITSDNLPQWIPTAVDCGLGASLGLQNIPASSRNRIGRLIGNILSGIFSGIQGTLRQSTEPLLPRDEPSGSSRQSGQDVQSSGGTER